MIKIETTVFIKRPSHQVFDYISNFENNPKWQGGMVSARFISEGPLQLGSTYVQVAKFLGRSVHSNFEVTAFEPGHIVKATTRSGSFPITFTRIVQPADGGTNVKAIVEGDASGFYKLAEPLMTFMVKRSVDSDYKNLKALLET